MRGLLGDEARVYLSRDRAQALREGDEVTVSIDVAKQVGIYPQDHR
ncbi:MAG: hypothetical protein U0R69_11350 [Gaiellales bacterium]